MTQTVDRLGVFTPGILRVPGLKVLTGANRLVFWPGDQPSRSVDAVAGWGHKPTAARARAYALRHGLPYLAVEEGFLRSVGLSGAEPPLSLVVDDCGIYYDARGPSRLEQLLESDARLEDARLLERAERFVQRMLASGVSKYNHAPDELPVGIEPGELVVVADQTYDDASVSGALADARSFELALECALDEHPGARVVVKVHPATVAGKKRGYLAALRYRARSNDRVSLLAANVSPRALLQRTRHLYVVSSQLGFEALLGSVPVTCFGQAFYSGWGLTDDRQASPRRTRRLRLSQLVAGALLLYPRYRHPLSGARCEAEEVLEHLALQRRVFAENDRNFVCFGMSRWKRPFVRRYLRSPGRRVRFVGSARELREEELQRATGVVWASRKTPELQRWAEARGLPLWSMEDGFLRSVGLGSDLTAPGSLVLDEEGIYYDPSRQSRLELILQNARFDEAELARAAELRRRILGSGISKYNLPAREPLRVDARPGQRVILVPGQVGDDASVRLGAGVVGDNLALLEAVRRANPDAYLVYKPHPDVLSGNRTGALHGLARPPWDALVGQVPLAECLKLSHEVHTMTSLVGFEALLRGLPVTTYGQPFYAGWGLTVDQDPLPRRTRRLRIDELVAGTLLRYPRYMSWSARCFVRAEDKVWELERAAEETRHGRLPRPAIKLWSLLRSGVEWWHGRGLEGG